MAPPTPWKIRKMMSMGADTEMAASNEVTVTMIWPLRKIFLRP